jgi:hypothetical protein
VLSEIDSVDLADFVRFVEMIQHTTSPQTVLRALIQKTVKHRLVKSSEQQRASLLGIFVEQLLLQGDVASAHSLLQGRMADPAFTATEYLVAFDAIIICNQIHHLCEVVMSECDLDLQLPSLQAVSCDPLEMYKCFLLIHSCSSKQASEDSRGNSSRMSFSASQSQRKGLQINTRQLCRNLLSDLKTAFAKCNLVGRRCPWVDVHALYVAYLEGIDQHKQVSIAYYKWRTGQ